MALDLEISVVVPTHNPNLSKLERVIQALNSQTLNPECWELIIIDNASSLPIEALGIHATLKSSRVIREERLGLSTARWRGVHEARSNLVVFVDDDNILCSSYLENVLKIFTVSSALGVIGGKSIPAYEQDPPSWFSIGMAPLGCRDLGDEILIYDSMDFKNHPCYPSLSPIGAGMAFRKVAVSKWFNHVLDSPITDRCGSSLSSAGDCDMVLFALESGWNIGYFPCLYLTHLISAQRVKPSYLQAISRCAYRDFIQVLDLHGIRPWAKISSWTTLLRAVKAWFTLKAWRGPVERLRWHSAIGQFEGRALIATR